MPDAKPEVVVGTHQTAYIVLSRIRNFSIFYLGKKYVSLLTQSAGINLNVWFKDYLGVHITWKHNQKCVYKHSRISDRDCILATT